MPAFSRAQGARPGGSPEAVCLTCPAHIAGLPHDSADVYLLFQPFSRGMTAAKRPRAAGFWRVGPADRNTKETDHEEFVRPRSDSGYRDCFPGHGARA